MHSSNGKRKHTIVQMNLMMFYNNYSLLTPHSLTCRNVKNFHVKKSVCTTICSNSNHIHMNCLSLSQSSHHRCRLPKCNEVEKQLMKQKHSKSKSECQNRQNTLEYMFMLYRQASCEYAGYITYVRKEDSILTH